MNKFLMLDREERDLIISNTADRMGVSKAIIEKDFWVCWTLDYLFNKFEYKKYICFKGGTCLSKVFNAIERFSEDIDIALDWSLLDVDKEVAYQDRSKRQQDLFNTEVNEKTEHYIRNTWLPLIKNDFSIMLNYEFDLYIDQKDPKTICFKYPQSYTDIAILQMLRIEIGVLAEPFPSSQENIETYITGFYPMVMNKRLISVKAVSAQRTFLEKITILHREANRSNKNYPSRYSRHFYDVYQLINQGIGEEVLDNLSLLRDVVDFNKKFYPCNWANYNEALVGRCLLIPNKEAIRIFRKDYENMKDMIYNNRPDFDVIIACLKEYEGKINTKILEESFIVL